jgi:hypothetical protein
MSILCWFIIWKLIFWILNLTLHVRYKLILIINWFYIIYIMHSTYLSKKSEQFFCFKGHIFLIHNFHTQKHIWTIQLVLRNVHSLIGWSFDYVFIWMHNLFLCAHLYDCHWVCSLSCFVLWSMLLLIDRHVWFTTSLTCIFSCVEDWISLGDHD